MDFVCLTRLVLHYYMLYYCYYYYYYYYCAGEVWKLLKAEDEDEQEPSRDNTNSRKAAAGTGSTSSVPFGGVSNNKPTASGGSGSGISSTSPSYTRADVCEVRIYVNSGFFISIICKFWV